MDSQDALSPCCKVISRAEWQTVQWARTVCQPGAISRPEYGSIAPASCAIGRLELHSIAVSNAAVTNPCASARDFNRTDIRRLTPIPAGLCQKTYTT